LDCAVGIKDILIKTKVLKTNFPSFLNETLKQKMEEKKADAMEMAEKAP